MKTADSVWMIGFNQKTVYESVKRYKLKLLSYKIARVDFLNEMIKALSVRRCSSVKSSLHG